MSNARQYHLAIAYNCYPSISQLALPTKDQSQGREPGQNIFNNNFEIRLRKLQMQQRRNYEVVGYKEIQDISLRLDRKKGLVQSGTKDKPTRLSRTSQPKNSQEYLTKEEVVKYYSPHQLATNRTHPHNQLTNSFDHPHPHPPTHCTHQSEQFSVARLKNKLQDYQCRWKKQIQNKRRLVKRRHKQPQAKTISVIESVDQYRIISEGREKLSIEEKLRNISPSMWQKILRSPNKTLQRSSKELSHVASSSGLKSVGHGKYQKELLWLEDKDKGGFFFKKDKTLSTFPPFPRAIA